MAKRRRHSEGGLAIEEWVWQRIQGREPPCDLDIVTAEAVAAWARIVHKLGLIAGPEPNTGEMGKVLRRLGVVRWRAGQCNLWRLRDLDADVAGQAKYWRSLNRYRAQMRGGPAPDFTWMLPWHVRQQLAKQEQQEIPDWAK